MVAVSDRSFIAPATAWIASGHLVSASVAARRRKSTAAKMASGSSSAQASISSDLFRATAAARVSSVSQLARHRCNERTEHMCRSAARLSPMTEAVARAMAALVSWVGDCMSK